MATIEQAKEALRMAKAIQQEVDAILKPQMTRQDIERIVAACGYNCRFDERVTAGRNAGDGTSRIYVMAKTRGAKNQKRRSLGRIETVEQMDQDELVKLIEKKFEKGGEP